MAKKLFYVLLLFGIFVAHNANAAGGLVVFVSSASVSQAGTLLVAVQDSSSKISGNVGNVKLRFFRSSDHTSWIALVGFPVDKKPGNYQLRITVPKKSVFKKQITVAKRTFPVDTLEITKEQQAQGYTAKKIIKTIETKENTVLNKVLNVFDSKTYAVKPFTYPLSTIDVVGSFGDIRVAQNQKIQHLGVDLKATVQTPVYAVNDGKVVFAKSLPDYGNIMVINHGLGVYSLYLHLADFNASEGQMVAQGDTIAHSGDTGYVTGPHLHFSIKVRGAALDPLQFIKASQAQKSP